MDCIPGLEAAVGKDLAGLGNDEGGARSPGAVRCAKNRVRSVRVCLTSFCADPAPVVDGRAGRGRGMCIERDKPGPGL
jgi:hypothetical protein